VPFQRETRNLRLLIPRIQHRHTRLIEAASIASNDGKTVMNGGGGDHQVRLRKGVARFSAFLDQEPPLEQNLFCNFKNAAIEHGTHLVLQPVVQFGPAMGIVDNFYAESNLGQGYDADIKLISAVVSSLLCKQSG